MKLTESQRSTLRSIEFRLNNANRSECGLDGFHRGTLSALESRGIIAITERALWYGGDCMRLTDKGKETIEAIREKDREDRAKGGLCYDR